MARVLKPIICPLLICFSCFGAELRGYLRLTGQNTPEVPADKHLAAPHGTLTLCNLDRIYRVVAGRDGQFVFSNVAAGEYALVGANGSSYAPEQVGSFRLNGTEVLGPSTFLLHLGNRQQHPCEVSTFGNNLLRDFDVSYKPALGRQALITGRVFRSERGDLKPLKNAEVKLFEAGSSRALQTTRSGRDGSFLLNPPKQGVYQLAMQHQKYHEIQVPPFMVPREDITVVELAAATIGSIVIER